MAPPPPKEPAALMGPPPPPLVNGAAKAKDAQDVAEKYSKLKKRFFELEQVRRLLFTSTTPAFLTMVIYRNTSRSPPSCKSRGNGTRR